VPVPKQKKSKSKVRSRRAHDYLTELSLVTCSNPECGEQMMPHRVCPRCGQYKGRQVIQVS